ncbi:MAG: hypothetical protein ACW9WZ_03940 [Nitrosopumilus sp.]
MQEKQLLGLSLTALGVIGGVFGLFVTGVFDTESISATYAPSTGMLMGHAIIEAHDSEGNLIAYRETDNEVVDSGEQCVLKMLFGAGGPAAAGTTVCTGATTQPWTTIAIGTTNTAASDTQVQLLNETSSSVGLTRGVATTQTWQNGTGATATQITLSKTFTNGGSSHTITESGLFNSTTVSGSGMLARQVFSGVTLANGDSITVTWTFSVGN